MWSVVAHIVNGGGDSFENERISNFQELVTLTLHRGHTAYRHASLIELYRHAEFHLNQKKFFVDRCTYGHL